MALFSKRGFLAGMGGLSLAGLGMPGAAFGQVVKSVTESRWHGVVRQDFDISCGASALCTILNYQHGERLSERDVALGLIDREEYLANPDLIRLREGFSLLDLKRFVDQRGYEGVGYGQLTYDFLLSLAPAIVPIEPNGYRHFVVFRGEFGGSVLMADPAYGNRSMSRARFERTWIEFPELGHVGFVVNRTDGLIPPNRLSPGPADFLVIR